MNSAIYDSIVRVRSRHVGRFRPISERYNRYARLRGTRILLVEDEEINQQVADAILSMVGCEVTAASNGLEALEKLSDFNPIPKFHVILMDIRMPGMDGIAVTRQIRTERRLDSLPIIAMTADAIQGIREDCLAAGMNDYLSKPINPDALFAALEKWITPALAPIHQGKPNG
jgi:two-component system sensor histidine kinase/response regulator